MKAIFLGSAVERSGKSMVTLGLAKNHGGRAGYFKPFREILHCIDRHPVDQDAHLMKQVLGLPYSEEDLSPFAYDVHTPLTMEEIVARYNRVKNDADIMLVEGTRDISTGCLQYVSGMAFSKAIGADVILVSSPEPHALDKICMLRRLLLYYQLNFKGVILNATEDPDAPKLLEKREIKILGQIPTIRELRLFRVKDIADSLGAEILAGEEGLGRTIEKALVGAMTAETALKYLRRTPRNALITGGDRSDLHLAALSTNTSCLILTGGLRPARPVLSKADELNIPVLLVDHSTIEAAEIVDHEIARIDPNDKEKISMVADLIKKHVDLDSIFSD